MTDPERPVPHSSPDDPSPLSQPLVPPPFMGGDQPPYGNQPPYAPPSPPSAAGPSAPPPEVASYGYPTPPPSMPHGGGGGRNVLGMIALVAAIVGALFAMVPGIFVIGWGLLPIAFVLAIFSLFQRGPKRAGVAALVISVLGTIIGIIVAFATLAFFFTSSYEGVSEVAGSPDSGMVEQGRSPADPLPLGTTITSPDWSVTVHSVGFDATDAVLAENEINEQPAEGEEYILVNLSTTYLGETEGYPAEVLLQYVTPDGEGIGAQETVVPDALDIGGALPTDGQASGNIAFLVPSATARDGVLSVSPGILADQMFVALE